MISDAEARFYAAKNGFPIKAEEVGDPSAFWAMVDQSGDCWPIAGRSLDKYCRVTVNGFRGLAHRISYALTHGETPALLVLHQCDRPGCVNPAHLFFGTNQDNADDKMRKGRHVPRGLSRWTMYLLEFEPDRLPAEAVMRIKSNPRFAHLLPANQPTEATK